MLNPGVIRLDLLSGAPALVGILTLSFGLFLLVQQRASAIGWLYLAFAASVGLYAFGAGVSYAVTGRSASLMWDRVAHAGVVFIPPTFAAASAGILGLGMRYRRHIRFLLLFAVVSLGLLVWDDSFIAGNQRLFWAWYPVYGPAGWALVSVFGLTMVSVIVVFVRELRQSGDPVVRQRLLGLVSGIVIGTVGAVDFLPALGAPIYAFGYVPISLFVLITGVVILRYRLVDITPESAATPILRTLKTAVLVTDRAGIVRVANPIAHEWLGLPSGALINRKLADVLPQVSKPIQRDSDLVQTSSDHLANGEFEWGGSAGEPVLVEVTVSDLALQSGEAVGTVYAAHDISDYRRAEERLTHLALHDGLTSLPNRTLLYERIRHTTEVSRRNQEFFCLLFIDLDGFKEINDTHGHDAGDLVLREIGNRLRSAVRAADTVARMGGDEFVVLAVGLTNLAGAIAVREKVRPSIQEPITLGMLPGPANLTVGGVSVSVEASIGLALYPRDGTDPETLIQAADAAMYAEKRSRKAAPPPGAPD